MQVDLMETLSGALGTAVTWKGYCSTVPKADTPSNSYTNVPPASLVVLLLPHLNTSRTVFESEVLVACSAAPC